MTEQVKQLPSKDDVQKISRLFELLIQIDQRERRKKNGNISEKAATAS